MTTFEKIKYRLNILADNDVIHYYTSYLSHHLGDSGIDLYHDNDIIVEPFKVGTVDFKIKCELIDIESNTFSSYYLVPRSSISKTPFQLANSIGIIDAGYRGNIMGKIRNFDPYEKSILPSGTYFQIVSPDLKPIEVKIVSELSLTSRNNGGFGSTNLTYTLYFDGCSKGNPGKGGAGALIYNNLNQLIWCNSEYVGDYVTNNYAEYSGLIIGLKKAIDLKITNLIIKGDSQLIIKQMNNEYKVKSNKDLYNIVLDLKNKFCTIEFIHINRLDNTEADAKANEAIIKK